jgi:hypothetical protein
MIVAGLLLPAILSLGTARAAETLTWPELPDKIGNQGADYSVVTKTGDNVRGRQLVFKPLGVFVAGPDSFVAQEQVAQIRIRHHESWKEVIVAPAAHMIASAPSMISPVGIWFPRARRCRRNCGYGTIHAGHRRVAPAAPSQSHQTRALTGGYGFCGGPELPIMCCASCWFS